MQDPRISLDSIDRALLTALQRNAHATAQELSETMNLSASQVGRRRQRLEEAGLITGYRARLDAGRLGLDVQAFIQIQLARHTASESRSFSSLLSTRPEIVSAWTMTGEADYLLRVYCPDLPSLNRLIHEVLLAHPSVNRVHSQIVMNQTKDDAPLPV